jgi:hypothetical protein
MPEIIPPQAYANDSIDLGCAYIVDEPGGRRACGAPRQGSSPYCLSHHSLCYLTCGSSAEAQRLREVETLASSVGGRRARASAGPSRRFLERLEQAVRSLCL